jgi:hypothetical protein
LAVKLKPSTFATAIGRDAALTKQCDRLGDTNVGALLSFIRICTQYLTLAWLRERERIRPLGAYSQPPVQESLEKKVLKNFRKYLVVKIKSLTFASAFETDSTTRRRVL